MKKFIVLWMSIIVLVLTGCGGSGTGSQIGMQGGNGTAHQQNRTVECSDCHGDGVCSHCDGDCFRNGRRCSVCDGTGICPYCEGAGSFEVFVINGKDYRLCGSCHGDGECGLCQGTGKYEQYFYYMGHVEGKCMVCKGSGKCLQCKGEGMVEVRGF